jgi:transcriptional regulator with XRE-family HTH domain
MENTTIKIGETIKKIRISKKLSQEDFSELIQVHRTYISPLERGNKNPSIITLKRITDNLHISLMDFFKMAEL